MHDVIGGAAADHMPTVNSLHHYSYLLQQELQVAHTHTHTHTRVLHKIPRFLKN